MSLKISGEVEVTNLDDDSKAKLEAFLEARIAATQGAAATTGGFHAG